MRPSEPLERVWRRVRHGGAVVGARVRSVTWDKPTVRSVLDPARRARWARREAAVLRLTGDVRAVAGPRSQELVVVSPHLDDAVLSCTGLLAAHPGARVVTAYTGGPARWTGLTRWDDACGFEAGDDVMAARKLEDRAALELLGAQPVWLDLVEGQYEPRPGPAEVLDRLRRALEGLSPAPLLLAIPLGVSHPDHVTVSDAMLELRAAGLLPDARWLVYGDLPYLERTPRGGRQRTATLHERGVVLEPVGGSQPADRELKRAAIHRYRSQVRPLWREVRLALRDERLWSLGSRPG